MLRTEQVKNRDFLYVKLTRKKKHVQQSEKNPNNDQTKQIRKSELCKDCVHHKRFRTLSWFFQEETKSNVKLT